MATMKAFIRPDDYLRGISLFVGIEKASGIDGAVSIIEGQILFEHVEEHQVRPQPFMYGEQAEAFVQAVLDAAWSHGMRPTGISGERGEIKRLEEHLADMRGMASKAIDHIIGGGK